MLDVLRQLLIGFIGGVAAVGVKGALDLYFERRREHRAVRAAARLVAQTLNAVSVYASLIEDAGHWLEFGEFAFDHDTWRENKALLAAAVSDGQWKNLTWAHYNVLQIEGLRAAALREADETQPAIDEADTGLVVHAGRAINTASSTLYDLSLVGSGMSLRRARVRTLERWRSFHAWLARGRRPIPRD